MKKLVLILCVLGFAFLMMGSALAVANPSPITIRCTGTIRDPNGTLPAESNSEDLQSQQTYYGIRLDQIRYFTIVAGVGCFAVAFLHNRKST